VGVEGIAIKIEYSKFTTHPIHGGWICDSPKKPGID
jgi:hypothetical protein